MKAIIVIAFTLYATIVSASPQGMPDFYTGVVQEEIPVKYRGLYYLHEKMGEEDEKMEHFSPAIPFGKIEAKQVLLYGGEILNVMGVQEFKPGLIQGLAVIFTACKISWGVQWMPGSVLYIRQMNLFPKLPGTIFVVSQNKEHLPPHPPPSFMFTKDTKNSATNQPPTPHP